MNRIFKVSMIVFFLFSGCVTDYKKLPKAGVEKEVSWSNEFKSCFGIDGGVKFDSKNPLVSSLIMDWINEKRDGFRAELTDPIGQLMLGMKINRKEIIFDGQLASKLYPLTMNENGVFEVDGNQVPLRWYELACFLKGHFPRSWLYHVVNVSYAGKDRELTLDWSNFRTIRIYPKSAGFCANIQWSLIFGFVSKSMSYCFNKETSAAYLEYEGNKLDWVPYGE